jgi:hypothetical protein
MLSPNFVVWIKVRWTLKVKASVVAVTGIKVPVKVTSFDNTLNQGKYWENGSYWGFVRISTLAQVRLHPWTVDRVTNLSRSRSPKIKGSGRFGLSTFIARNELSLQYLEHTAKMLKRQRVTLAA